MVRRISIDPIFFPFYGDYRNYLRFIRDHKTRSDFHLTTPCKICNGAEQNIFYNGDEPSDPIDCICTDMNWDSENQDKCLHCKGAECEYCNGTGVRKN